MGEETGLINEVQMKIRGIQTPELREKYDKNVTFRSCFSTIRRIEEARDQLRKSEEND